MKLTLNDEIGKLIATLIIGPIMIYKGFIYNDLLLGILGLLLLVYDGYWICKYYSKKNKLNKDKLKIDNDSINDNTEENITLEVSNKL